MSPTLNNMYTEEMAEKLKELLKEAVPETFQNETLQKELKLTDVDMEKLYREGYSAYQENKIQEAHEIFMLLALLNPFIQKYWVALGAADMSNEKWDDALKRLAIATLLEPSDPYPHLHAYYCYKALGNRDEASIALERAHEEVIKKPTFSMLREEIDSIRRDAWQSR